MFGMQHTFKQLSGGIAVAAVVAIVAVPSAFSMTVITDTLGGNGSAKATPDAFQRAVAIHTARQARQVQGITLITDTLGGNGFAKQAMTEARAVAQGYLSAVPYVNGGMSAAVAQSNQQPSRASLPYAYGGMSVAVAQSNQTSGPASNPSPYFYGGNSAQLAKPIQSPYLYGGDSPRFSTGIQDTGNGVTSAPSVTGNPSGTGFSNWGLAGLGAALAAALLLARLLIGGPRPRQPRRVRTV